MSWDQIDVGLKFATDSRRHTDGVQPGNSERAVANGYPGHTDLLVYIALFLVDRYTLLTAVEN